MEGILRRLMDVEGVTGALIAGKDGLVIASAVEGQEEELLGAMVAACFDSSLRYVEQLGMGPVRYAHFETAGGVVQFADGGQTLVVAQATPQAGLGRIRLELQRAARQLMQQTGTP
jgi:predicted regulator of Ras-like GTPase activity (Roadblock/LC7/MglB family)